MKHIGGNIYQDKDGSVWEHDGHGMYGWTKIADSLETIPIGKLMSEKPKEVLQPRREEARHE